MNNVMNNVVKVFTYGTLQPGHANHVMLRGSVVGSVAAELPGHHLAEHLLGDYPVAVPNALLAEQVRLAPVQGRLLWVRPTDDLEAVTTMEVLAGYDARWLDVLTDDGHLTVALCFVWNSPEHGQRLADGIWRDTAKVRS